MFDIGFSEILLIFGLALIVLGPEKLPRVASQVGRWIGRARGMARQFREQLEEEVNLEEARKSRPPAITSPPPPPSPAGTSPAGTPPAAIEAPATGHDANPPADAVAVPHSPGEHPLAAAAQPEQPQYSDGYSHAHPTDSEGRPVPSPADVPPGTESGQHDWVGVPAGDGGSAGHAVPAGDAGVTPTHKPAQGTTDAGYAPPHERGT